MYNLVVMSHKDIHMDVRKVNDPVLTYKMQSEIYRNIKLSAASADLSLDERLNMLALLRAETFEQMLNVASRFDMNAQSPILHSTVKVCSFEQPQHLNQCEFRI